MVNNLGRNRNTSDAASPTSYTQISVDTAVTVASAFEERQFFAITVRKYPAFLRFQDAATDPSERKGILIAQDFTYEMPVDNIYTGEISLINRADGQQPEYSVTEY